VHHETQAHESCRTLRFCFACRPDCKIRWKQGDVFQASVEGDALKLSRAQAAHESAMEIAEQVMEEYRETFEALAKS
jgi:hypothetical protein